MSEKEKVEELLAAARDFQHLTLAEIRDAVNDSVDINIVMRAVAEFNHGFLAGRSRDEVLAILVSALMFHLLP